MSLLYTGYPKEMTQPMELELTEKGIVALHSSEEVHQLFDSEKEGTILLFVNSVCGCAAGNARPALLQSLQHTKQPTKIVTVFAGVDKEATMRAREYVKEFQSSSPSMFLFKNGKVVFSLERYQIEGRDPSTIATDITTAFDEFC